MSYTVKKRNGNEVVFNLNKIYDAIFKAAKSTEEHEGEVLEITEETTDKVDHKLHEIWSKNKDLKLSVEKIQEIIENTLMENEYFDIARNYILYKEKHKRIRNIGKTHNEAMTMIDDYLNLDDWKVNENSNMGYSLQGLNNHISSEITERYWLQEIYTDKIKEAHDSGNFHIHDLDQLSVYCVGWDLEDLLLEGFSGVESKIESNPPKHFDTALMQVVNFLFTLQGESAGAQAFSSFDTYLAPFIAYDDLSYKEVKQAMQKFIYNLNVPTRVGFQTPFTNITMDLAPNSALADQSVIIGGEYQDRTYKEFQEEMDMLNKAFAEVMIEGDRKDRMFSFPIPTYNVTEDFPWDNEVLKPVWEMTAKYGIPYFSNFLNSSMSPDDVRSMCPLGGSEKILIKTENGLRYSKINHAYYDLKDKEIEIYSDGSFVKGKLNKWDNQELIEVELENGHKIKMTKTHLNFVTKEKNGEMVEVTGDELKQGYYLPYSLNEHKGKGGNYDLGFFVGAYAGDGSYDGESCVIFSLGKGDKETTLVKLKEIAEKYFGTQTSVTEYEDTELVTFKVFSKAAVGLCKDFVSNKQRDKHYNANLYGMSKEFREGVLAGHLATDGGNRNRIYTSSEKMVESLNMLASTLGTTTSIYEDDRTKKENTFSDNTNYAVLVYKLNRNSYGDIWFKQNDRLWVQIKSIKEVSGDTGYCFEVTNNKPMFTVGTTGILTHNCRLRIDNTELKKRGGGLFGANPLTGSIGVITINLVRIGYLSETKEEYFERLEELMYLAKEALETKRKVLERLTERGLYPYAKFYLRNVKQRFGEYWKNHFNTIGILGMNESLINFIDKTITSEEGQEFGVEVMDFMRDKLREFQEETGNIFNLEATPGEGTTYRFASKDKELYGDNIVCANQKRVVEEDADSYYTNSTHLPVGYTNDIFEELELQNDFQKKFTGGTVIHAFMGERMPNIEATKKLIKRAFENFELPYLSVTPTFSICPVHGYLEGEHEYCPKC